MEQRRDPLTAEPLDYRLVPWTVAEWWGLKKGTPLAKPWDLMWGQLSGRR